MVMAPETTVWREARRQSARDAIVQTAWVLSRELGLAGWSIRDLARRSGITTPTVYAYFDSKNAIYDAMFGQAATEFADRQAEPYDGADPQDRLLASTHRFFEFCTNDPPRYQLLFQRTLPGFEPSASSYEPAVRALAGAGAMLAACGVTDARHLDLWTGLIRGLVDQQLSNDPGGDRWERLLGESVDMFLTHCAPSTTDHPLRPGG